VAKGIARKGFDLDLKDGLQAEDRLREILLNKKIEVKSDKQAWKTGNIFVEDSCSGKPSGISTTEAEFWAYELRQNTFYLVPIERLRELFKEAVRHGKRKAGGDFNRSSGVLIPLEWLVSR
jgi:hypothetical protein